LSLLWENRVEKAKQFRAFAWLYDKGFGHSYEMLSSLRAQICETSFLHALEWAHEIHTFPFLEDHMKILVRERNVKGLELAKKWGISFPSTILEDAAGAGMSFPPTLANVLYGPDSDAVFEFLCANRTALGIEVTDKVWTTLLKKNLLGRMMVLDFYDVEIPAWLESKALITLKRRDQIVEWLQEKRSKVQLNTLEL
jgi:hypothetical protein